MSSHKQFLQTLIEPIHIESWELENRTITINQYIFHSNKSTKKVIKKTTKLEDIETFFGVYEIDPDITRKMI